MFSYVHIEKNKVNIENYTQHWNTQKAHKLEDPPVTLSSLYMLLQGSFQKHNFPNTATL